MVLQNKKIVYLLIGLVGAYYWVAPLVKQIITSFTAKHQNVSLVGAYPDPVIKQAYFLPGYHTVGTFSKAFEPEKNSYYIMIFGEHLKSLNEQEQIRPVIKINGQDFAPINTYAVENEDSVVEVDIASSKLGIAPYSISVSRDNRPSNTVTVAAPRMAQQISQFSQSTPQIIAALPIGYPYNKYAEQATVIRVLFSGWPLAGSTFAPQTVDCSLMIDGKNVDCARNNTSDHPNSFDIKAPIGTYRHNITLTLNHALPSTIMVNSMDFEKRMADRQKLRDNYYGHIISQEPTSVGSVLSIADRWNSIVALGVNFVLTLLSLLFLKPWRSQKLSRWIMAFELPVIVVMVFGVTYGVLHLNGDFIAPVLGFGLILITLKSGLISAAEAGIVAVLLHYLWLHTRVEQDSYIQASNSL